jgi:protein O-mannosyl-transferase
LDTTQKPLDASSLTQKSPGATFWAGAGLMALAILAIYYPMIHGFYTWDDDWHVVGNPYLHDMSGLLEMFNPAKGGALFFPVSLTMFWIERSFFGVQNPMPFHVVSILLHAINTIVLWRLLQRLNIRWAALAAAIFAIHPLHVETVAWISEQKTLLACLFTFLTTWAYVEFLDAPAAARPWRRWLFLGLALLLFLLAVLSKAVVCTLPVALLLIAYWRRGAIKWTDVTAIVPFLGLSLAIAYIYAMPNLDHPIHGEDIAFYKPERIVIAGRAVWFYIGKILSPYPLLPIYPRWNIYPQWYLTAAWWEYLPPALLVGLLAVLWLLRRRISRGPFVAIAILVLTLSPGLGFISFSYFRASFVADHFAYPADVALIVLCVGILRTVGMWLSTHLKQAELIPKYWTEAVWIIVLVVLLGPLARGQASLWGDQIKLWQYGVDNNPKSWMAHTCLAMAYGKAGDIENAKAQAAISLAYRKNADAFRIHATALMFEGARDAQEHPAEARRALTEAAADFREDMEAEPELPDPCIRLGEVEEKLGDLPKAIAAYREAVKRQPRLFQVWSNLARCESRLQHWPEAIDAAQHATALDPAYPPAHFNLAMALRGAGKLSESIAEFRTGLQLDPGVTMGRLQLANALADAGQLQEALQEYRRVVQERPDLLVAHARMADVLDKLGDKAGAAMERAATQPGGNRP